MNVYKINLPRALGFVALSLILTVAVHLGLNQTLGRDLAKKDGPIQKLAERLRQVAAGAGPAGSGEVGSSLDADEKIAGDRTKTIAERQAALTDLYQRLDSMFESLPPGQSDARADYDARKAHYEQLLAALREDAHRAPK
jgi:uncharacterized protein involved in exopolysaccharide biosynthesis